MATPASGGFAESLPRRVERRRQNPHMHLFEALLDRHGRLAGTPRHPCAEALLASATLGVMPDLRVLDRMRASGTVADASIRLWPHTEAARAACCSSFGDRRAMRAVRILDQMQRRFLRDDGTWIDRFDANGIALSGFVPASSLYHICGAVDAVERGSSSSGSIDQADA